MIEMTLETAESVAKAAHGKAIELGVSLCVTVVDESGRLVLCSRGDGASFFSPETSRAKAVAAAAFRAPTNLIAQVYDKAPRFWDNVSPVLGGQILPSGGAVPIVRDGEVIGAVGCGGARNSEEDHECAEAGAASISE